MPAGEARGLRLAPKTSRESVASVCWRIRPAQCSRHEAASEGETGVVAQPPASGLRFDEENLGIELSVKRGRLCPGTSLTFSGRFLPAAEIHAWVGVKVPDEVLFILYQSFVINRSASWPLNRTLGGKSAAGVLRRGEEVL